MSRTFSFFASGEPKGQPRPRAVIRRSRGGQVHAGVFDAGTADNWKACVKLAAQRAGLAHANLSGPVSLTLRFFFPRPAAHHKSGDRAKPLKDSAPAWQTAKPDVDNAAKAVMDALTDYGAWLDDSQVCQLRAEKFYTSVISAMGCEITIRTLAD